MQIQKMSLKALLEQTNGCVCAQTWEDGVLIRPRAKPSGIMEPRHRKLTSTKQDVAHDIEKSHIFFLVRNA